MAKIEGLHVPVTVEVDVDALLTSSLPEGYDPENDEVIYGGPVIAEVVKQAAALMAQKCAGVIAEEAVRVCAKQVADEVSMIVRDTLDAGVTIGTGYSKTVVKPLRELIKDEVDEWVKGGSKTESWDSRKKNPLHELIRKEVDQAMVADVRQSITEAKEIAKAAVKAKAAEIVAAAVVR